MDRHHKFSFAVYLIFLLGTSDFYYLRPNRSIPPNSEIFNPLSALLKVLHAPNISFFVFLALQFMFLTVSYSSSLVPWNVQIQLEFLFFPFKGTFLAEHWGINMP